MSTKLLLATIAIAGLAAGGCHLYLGESDSHRAVNGCLYEGQIKPFEQVFAANDGCNNCYCHDDGRWECTAIACYADAGPVDAHGDFGPPDAHGDFGPPDAQRYPDAALASQCTSPNSRCCDTCVWVAECSGVPTEVPNCEATCNASAWVEHHDARCLAVRIAFIDEEGCTSILDAYENFQPDDQCTH